MNGACSSRVSERSSQAANAACSWARRAVGRVAYVTSRVMACLKESSSSPTTDEPECKSTRPRSESRRKSGSEPPVSSRTGPAQNTRPITEAACRAPFSTGPSRSILAASVPWIESGTSSSAGRAVACQLPPEVRARMPRSTREPTSSSRKNGLPSERARIISRSAGGRSPGTSSLSIRSAVSLGNGSRRRTSESRGPAPQPGRRSCSSGRAVTSRSKGPPVSRATRSSRSSSGSSARCRSSTRSTTGRPDASSDTSSTNAACRRSRAARGWSSGPASRPSAIARSWRASSRCRIVSGESVSRISKCWRSISPIGQYVIPVP